jgi:sulfoxide reductase catalytic subunit YedY
MLTKTKTSWDLPSSDVTPETVYRSRREFMSAAIAGAAGLAAGSVFAQPVRAQANLPALAATRNAKYVAPDRLNSFQDITTYNNFYEFGLEKSDPSEHAHALTVKPWTVKVDGLVAKPGNYGVEDLINFKALEERVYRLRCVEAWSMVIPWIGVPVADVLAKVQPTSAAKFVEFTTLQRPAEMFGQRSTLLDWPYVEGLRLDEALHPLAFMVVGLYGKVLPNQNGAPMRLMVPWKYGFKSGKSIVRIRLTDQQPRTTWPMMAPDEYGFYANVNPTVHHPRWRQDRENRLPAFLKNTPTQMFNGYAEVASLYTGLDLRTNY